REQVRAAITAEKNKGRFVIMFLHWGNEYQTQHSPAQEVMAKEWIAAGAGLIIGSHPHVVQDIQLVDGVLVIYSLGNLVFDQTFSNETQQGLLVGGKVDQQTVQVSLYPLKMVNAQPSLLFGPERADKLSSLLAGLRESVAAQQVKLVNDDTIVVDRIK
ncbi:MAG: CapA family protein, partial [bacterium]|nr:CapA family protein [bacterium]